MNGKTTRTIQLLLMLLTVAVMASCGLPSHPGQAPMAELERDADAAQPESEGPPEEEGIGQAPMGESERDPDAARPDAGSSSGLCGAPLAILLLLGLAVVTLARPVCILPT